MATQATFGRGGRAGAGRHRGGLVSSRTGSGPVCQQGASAPTLGANAHLGVLAAGRVDRQCRGVDCHFTRFAALGVRAGKIQG